MNALFNNVFGGQTVLVTGHTGFKGSWLSCWLIELGANVVGYSLASPPTTPSNFNLMDLQRHMTDVRGELGDLDHLQATLDRYRPVAVFHLAAQPIVLRGYQEPKLTFDSNAAGTVNVLEAIRRTSSVRALVSITTDKVYKNQGWLWGYRETDRLGDPDPYGASKAMAELAVQSYRASFFNAETYADHGVAVATTRAGNVIGGGDFAPYRLVPDSMKALLAGEPISIRNPWSVRPWQHVLEPLSGYLLLASRLLTEGPAYAEPWNFGPREMQGVAVEEIVTKLIALWGAGSWEHTGPQNTAEKESHFLRLSWEKAASRLGWKPVYTLDGALGEIAAWFKAYRDRADMHAVCRDHIAAYVNEARTQGLAWAQDAHAD